jgi:hypothetical protein
VGRRRYTLEDVITNLPSYVDSRAKVISSVSFTIKNYTILMYLKETLHLSISDIVNEVLNRAFSNCESTCDYIDKLIEKMGQSGTQFGGEENNK